MTAPASSPGEDGGRRRVGAAADLAQVLERQRSRDLLGPDPLPDLIAHSSGFAEALGAPPRRAVDLGSGGGVPGLVLAADVWLESEIVLVDASQRRTTYLELCVDELDLGPRVTVLWGRGEEVGRDPAHRAAHDAVVARSFGPAAVVAECAAPLLEVGGHLVVSEPPGSGGRRWDEAGLAVLGLELDAVAEIAGATFARLRQVAVCPPAYPRRPGVPVKRPLFA